MGININDQYITDKVAMYCADTTEAVRMFDDEYVDFIVYSPPFSQLYTYSNSDRDLGNSRSDEEFFTHFEFIVKELYRILKSGRIMAVHCMQIPAMKERDGYIGIKDFRGDLIRLFQKNGFIYHSEVTVWKDPVVEMQRTKALGLLHKQLKKDSSKSRMGIPDYIIIMRKPGESAEPITHTNETYPVREWQQVASPVWDIYPSPVWWDINQSDTLNRMFSDEESEKHICLAEGTMVLTKRGYVPIETVDVNNDEVLTNSGEWHRVIAKAKTKSNAEVVQVRANGVPKLILTPDHNVMAKRGYGVHKKDNLCRAEEEWVEASNLMGCYAKSVLPPIIKSKISEEEWWIIGRWVADGHIDARGHQFFVSIGDYRWDLFENKAKKFIGHIIEKPECNCKQVGLTGLSKEARAILKKIGRRAENKTLPIEVISLNRELSKAFLDGYQSGDGSKCNGKTFFSSSSRALLLGVGIVCQRVYGRIPSIYAGRGERESFIRGNKIHSNQEWIMVLSPNYCYSKVENDGTSWKKVNSVTSIENSDVWSIEVEHDHSYVAEGIVVKNCPLQLPVIERLVNLYTNEGEVVFTPFMGIGSEVYQAMKMGRKGIGIELKEVYFEQAVKNIKSLEYESKQITLEDYFSEEFTQGE